MLAKIVSGAILGVDGYIVEVEVDLASGLPGFEIVGLPDSAVKESRERVRAAIRNSEYAFPVKRITVNLAPADIKKSGPAYDLPIAVGILICTGTIPENAVADSFVAGELSLDGALRPINGVLPMVLAAKAAGKTNIYVPAENASEAALVEGVTVYPVENIRALVDYFAGKAKIQQVNINIADVFAKKENDYGIDFHDVHGQAMVKRALEVAAAGYHNALMIGPPGAGKTMMARRLPTILPDLSISESMEITKIYSIAGLLTSKSLLMTKRPFRTPHHTASYVSLAGGGRTPTPGEMSLAHNGVLFLDELPEFQKKALETMRQPLEDGSITITRVGGTSTYPSVFLLLATMNPCPCGYMGSDRCTCTEAEIGKYLDKISGPLLDRIDIQVEAAAVQYAEISAGTGKAVGESSATIKERVENARARQASRFKDDGIYFNAKMTAPMIEKYCQLTPGSQEMLKMVFDSMQLSARAYHKILKIARSIADLADSEDILEAHVAEAISYRGLDRKYF